MKKALSLILALVLCLGLCACGGGGGNADAPAKKYSLGETITTDNWEITLSQVTFGTNLCKETETKDYMIVDGDYETTFSWGGETHQLAYVAEEGRAFVSVAYTMKYIGKETIKVFNRWPDMKVNYNNGYLFEDSPYADGSLHVWNGEKFEEVHSPNIEPLSPAAEYRDCFDVPVEVKENTSGTVEIVIDLKQDGTYTYTVR